MLQLDLGCGTTPRQQEGYEIYGIDIVDVGLPNIKQADLAIESIPFEDSMFDLVTSFDFIEHIPNLVYVWDDELKRNVRRNAVIELFNEIDRVLKVGGIFHCMVPEWPRQGAIQDPTHVSMWCEESLNYFSGNYYGFKDHYGHTSNFEKVRVWRDSRFSLHMFFEFKKAA